MDTGNKTSITVQSTINANVEKVWQCWTDPQHITQWCAASDDWHAPHATNDLRKDGSFSTRMEAKDGSFGFSFGGIYTEVIPHHTIAYKMDDGRTVKIGFSSEENQTKIVETFDAEQENPIEMQQTGWQAILDNFKKYTESQS